MVWHGLNGVLCLEHDGGWRTCALLLYIISTVLLFSWLSIECGYFVRVVSGVVGVTLPLICVSKAERRDTT